jgi:hypothetical protein
MRFSLEPLASLATIVGTVVSILALMQSSVWLVVAGVVFAVLGIAIVLYARSKRLTLDSASTVIEGQSIDSLNIANLRRRVNRTFFVQDAFHTVRIEGKDMEITWKYSGYCKAEQESAFEFSIDSEDSTAFAELHCIAFDLGHDPEMKHEIRPLLVGTDGISKKISVPFLAAIKANEAFGILLKCRLPRCLSAGSGYYTSTSSFAQDRVPRSTVNLIFAGVAPRWVRVYESKGKRPAELVKTLALSRQEPGLSEYLDVVEGRPGQSARVYMFWRESV